MISDEELLSILHIEQAQSVGFENNSELLKKRKTALKYYKGEMDDIPALNNRSRAVASDIADAVETVLPDLMEIFTGGEDVATFLPQSQEDEDAAKQETEYVNYIAFQKLPGWRLLHTAFKDALLIDTGIIETWWEDKEETNDTTYEGVTAGQIQLLAASGINPTSIEPIEPAPDGMPLFNVRVSQTRNMGCIRAANVNPSNLSVARETVNLSEATYVVVRLFPRAQELIEQGFDPELVERLPTHYDRGEEDIEMALDVAGEQDASAGNANLKMRQVKVHKHWVRTDVEGNGKRQLYLVHTDADCNIILDKRPVERIGLAAGTPFIQSHRFYGISLSEKLVEIQRIKTALLRLMLDSGYFALNQRVEVSEDASSFSTIDDILRNEPGAPIRSRTGQAVRPISSGALNFDVQMALEYASIMGEGRSGVVRNAQGLNPDTLHDTAKGAQALMTMAQKRIRMIARVLAETLVKDLMVNIHSLARVHSTHAEKVRLSGKWVDIDPSSFGSRADMQIEVGVGSGGKEAELANMRLLLDYQKQIIQIQGGPGGLVSMDNVYNLLKRFTERAGFKSADLFFSNPSQAEQQQAGPQGPTPEQTKMQADMDAAKAKFDAQTQLDQTKLQADMQMQQMRLQAELEQARQKAELEGQLAREKMAQEMQLAREKMALEAQMGRLNAPATVGGFQPGGRLDQ
jgi:hypothetical protein